MAPEVVIVVARADNGIIGRDGRLPWRLPADLRRFKTITMGAPMVMGRKTFESLPGLLPGRRHIVLTRDPSWRAEGAEAAHTPDEALALAGSQRVSVIGGADIIRLFLPQASAIELTEVHLAADGDVFMPAPDAAQWREASREYYAGELGRPAYSFVRLERASSASAAAPAVP